MWGWSPHVHQSALPDAPCSAVWYRGRKVLPTTSPVSTSRHANFTFSHTNEPSRRTYSYASIGSIRILRFFSATPRRLVEHGSYFRERGDQFRVLAQMTPFHGDLQLGQATLHFGQMLVLGVRLQAPLAQQ